MISIANPDIGPAEHDQVAQVLDSGTLADGPKVRSFEDAFATYCDVDHGVATSNGTTALHAALWALGIGDGDRVVTTPFSFGATANAIRLAGAEPVFADVDRRTFNLDPDDVERTVRDHEGDVDAVLAVHLYGLPADVERLAEIADRYDAALVEDAAQAHGASVDGQRVGSIGDVGCFSFYPTKNMTTGEGGMITTDDRTVAERAARFVDHGRANGHHVDLGHNFRMTSIAAAIGLAQLEKLPDYVEARRRNAETLTEELRHTPVTVPFEPRDRTHVYHQYTIRTSDRDGLTAHLDEQDIGYGVYYPSPIHAQPAYDGVDVRTPRAEAVAGEVVSLPVHPGLDPGDVSTVAEGVRSYAG